MGINGRKQTRAYPVVIILLVRNMLVRDRVSPPFCKSEVNHVDNGVRMSVVTGARYDEIRRLDITVYQVS